MGAKYLFPLSKHRCIHGSEAWQVRYKGNDYEVIGDGLHSETHEVIIYRALYRSEEFGDNAIWVRPLASFTETVEAGGRRAALRRL